MATTFIPLPDSSPRDRTATSDGRLFLATKTRLRAFDLAEGRLLWERSWTAPAPDFYCVPRRIRGTDKILRLGEEGLLHLSDEETGVVVRCHDPASGRVCWERRVPTPLPLPWTEAAPVCPDAKTEEIGAFLLLQMPGLALARTSRRATIAYPKLGTFPAPPYQAQLEILALEGASGRDRWTSILPGVGVPILEEGRFTFLLRRGSEILDLDAETGAPRLLGRTPKPCAWPRRAGGKAVTAWRTSKGVGLSTLDGRETFLERKNTREVALHEAGPSLILQFNERSFCLVHPDLRTGPEIPIKGYLYGVAASPDGLLAVATSGAGGGLYAVDPASGEQVTAHLLPQGAWQVVAVPEAGKAVAVCGAGVAILDVRSGRLSLEPLPCAGAIAGVQGRRVAVLTREPEPAGIHLLDL